VSANFSVDDAEGQYLVGYLRGLSTEIETKQHLGSVVKFTQTELKNRFALAVDQAARLNKDRWYHVYEWGDTWATRKDNAGDPENRLWKLTSAKRGTGSTVGFTFLPSVVPTPLHPEEEAVGVEQRHTFTWKAPVMEYGQTVTISPVEALHGKLVFYWEKIDKVVATTKTITTKTDPAVVGVFSSYFVAWWRTEGPSIFEKEIRPMLERDIVPRTNGRFAKGRTLAESRALAAGARGGRMAGSAGGSRASVNIGIASAEKGRADAIKTMRRIAAGYNRGAGGEGNYRGNDDE
jgi:hypothetical protein